MRPSVRGPSRKVTPAGRCQATVVGLTWNCIQRVYDCPAGMWPSPKVSLPSVEPSADRARLDRVDRHALGPARVEDQGRVLHVARAVM